MNRQIRKTTAPLLNTRHAYTWARFKGTLSLQVKTFGLLTATISVLINLFNETSATICIKSCQKVCASIQQSQGWLGGKVLHCHGIQYWTYDVASSDFTNPSRGRSTSAYTFVVCFTQAVVCTMARYSVELAVRKPSIQSCPFTVLDSFT